MVGQPEDRAIANRGDHAEQAFDFLLTQKGQCLLAWLTLLCRLVSAKIRRCS